MEKQYETPKLVLVGEANEVVLGPPGPGRDGAYGLAIGEFEFDEDELPPVKNDPAVGD